MCLLIMFLFHQHGWKLSRGLLESIQWHHPYKCWNVYNEAYENKVINMPSRHITIAELPE